jgi:hypothetical protein
MVGDEEQTSIRLQGSFGSHCWLGVEQEAPGFCSAVQGGLARPPSRGMIGRAVNSLLAWQIRSPQV